MTDDEEDRGGAEPCLAHLLVDGHPVDPETVRDVARFRRAERARLLRARALSVNDRNCATARLSGVLAERVEPKPGLSIAAYWPIRGEPDLRDWMKAAHQSGATVLLPVVMEKQAPIAFRTWTPGCRMERGFWNIPVPADGVTGRPDIVIAPLVGADEDCYRLGNGGGYYDRTLVRLDPAPRKIGVGFADCLLPTIYPMPWDVPMDEIILSDGTVVERGRPPASG